jgi:hypothetical protein
MKSVVFGLAAALLLASAAPAAFAAKTINIPSAAADGSITGNFGDTGLGLGDFTDVFTFTLPDGIAAADITSTMVSTDLTTNVDFTSVDLNGSTFTLGSTGKREYRFLDDILVTGGTQTLTVHGKSGGNGSFAGTIAFTAAPPIITSGGGVPEPAAWALMIVGFGGAGSMLRIRRRATRFA